jgi:hypothetical protein
MGNKIGLNDEVDVPYGSRPVVNMNCPGIFRKVAPIIFKDAKLHHNHGDDHPEM